MNEDLLKFLLSTDSEICSADLIDIILKVEGLENKRKGVIAFFNLMKVGQLNKKEVCIMRGKLKNAQSKKNNK